MKGSNVRSIAARLQRRTIAAASAALVSRGGMSLIVALGLLALTPGCGQQQKKKPSLLTVPEKVLIARGGKVKLKATINGDALAEDVDEKKLTIVVKNPLPEGLRLKDGDNPKDVDFKSKPDKKTKSVVWTLLADVEAPVDMNAKLRVEVRVNGQSEPLVRKEIPVTIHDFTLSTGWPVMVVSVTTVLCLVGFCLWRVLTLPPVEVEEHLQGPLTIETPDLKEPE